MELDGNELHLERSEREALHARRRVATTAIGGLWRVAREFTEDRLRRPPERPRRASVPRFGPYTGPGRIVRAEPSAEQLHRNRYILAGLRQMVTAIVMETVIEPSDYPGVDEL